MSQSTPALLLLPLHPVPLNGASSPRLTEYRLPVLKLVAPLERVVGRLFLNSLVLSTVFLLSLRLSSLLVLLISLAKFQLVLCLDSFLKYAILPFYSILHFSVLISSLHF